MQVNINKCTCTDRLGEKAVGVVLDCPQPSIFSFFFFSIDERAVRTAKELDASAKRKKQGGGSPSPHALTLRARFFCFICVEKSRGCGQSRVVYLIFLICSSIKYPYPPYGRSLEIPGGRGLKSQNFLKLSMGLNWNFQRGGGFKPKTFCGRGMDIFWNNTIIISHVQNEQGTGYEYSISIALKNWARHLKEHPKISNSTKVESYWFKRIGMVHF